VSRRACVIGHPVSHSRSPLIHGYWLREHKIDGQYVREDVPPAAIGSFLDRLGETYVGANVTIPHKEAAFAKLKHPDPVARALGAANTLWFEHGALNGTNTDVHGFLAHLDASLSGWDRRTETALVLGAGGAARSIVYALLERGVARVMIANRSRARAEALAERFGSRIVVVDLASVSKALATADLLVNAASLGMKGQPPLGSISCRSRRPRRSMTSSMCRLRRRSWPRREPAAIRWSTALACCCTRPFPASSAGSACGRL
jgi:shikimate dehydrogenase